MYRKQKYSACQLIAAINARIFLGEGDVSDAVFEQLVDLAKCRNGAALNVEATYKFLGLKSTNGPLNVSWIEKHLPVGITIHSPHYGFHNVLVERVTYTKVMACVPIFHLVNHEPDNKVTWMEMVRMLPQWDHQQDCRSFELLPSL